MIHDGENPVVTVVVPMLDERDYILRCLQGFAAQTYPPNLLDVVVVDGGSTDGSRALVEEFAEGHPWCRALDNPARKAAAAFNVGVENAKGDVLVLFSAHGEPDPDFVERSVAVLHETGVAGVGGRYIHAGTDARSSAIGLAMVSPFGMASPHRFAASRRDVDTISHPAYDIRALRAVGPFDEKLERNSDYELNWRLREAGHRLVFDPTVVSVYRPRRSVRALARQFWWYGRWKERVIRRHPESLRARHLVPPAVVVGAPPALVLLGRSPGGRRLLATAAAAYAAADLAAVAHARPRRHGASRAVLAVCFPTMHVAWGAGFVASVVEDAMRGRR